MWSFETDPEFQASLDWIDEFTREEIELLDLVFREPGDPWDPTSGLCGDGTTERDHGRDNSGHAIWSRSWATRLRAGQSGANE